MIWTNTCERRSVNQFKGKVFVVLTKEQADGIITGVNEEQKGTAAKITGRYLGLHGTVNGTIFPARQKRRA
jgi:hypothetical protein